MPTPLLMSRAVVREVMEPRPILTTKVSLATSRTALVGQARPSGRASRPPPQSPDRLPPPPMSTVPVAASRQSAAICAATRRKLPFSADRAWPHPGPKNASSRAEFKLSPDRALK